jgi:hypothetical protein
MRHATALLYHVCAVASRNIRFASCGTSGKLTLWTRYAFEKKDGLQRCIKKLQFFFFLLLMELFRNELLLQWDLINPVSFMRQYNGQHGLYGIILVLVFPLFVL